MKYRTIDELNAMITGFESGSISRDVWKHSEHLFVACSYILESDLNAATDKMRSGIMNLLRAFGIPKDENYPYHETLTVFWMRTIAAHRERYPDLDLLGFCERGAADFSTYHPHRFYSQELLATATAKTTFVEPDLAEPDGFRSSAG